MNVLDREKRARILHWFVDGGSLRAIARAERVSINTVYKLFRDAGDTAIEFLNQNSGNIACRRVQADEVYGWFGHKPKYDVEPDGDDDVDEDDVPYRDGVPQATWVWLAIDPESKFIINHHLGTRSGADCQRFIGVLKTRLANRVQLSTDGLRSYFEAVQMIFGTDVDYGKIEKPSTKLKGRKKGSPKARSTKTAMIGNPDPRHISTSIIESFNSRLRRGLCRFHRKTDGWSKTRRNMERAIALFVWYYNWANVHGSLRVSPAMEAGVADVLWYEEDMLDVIDAATGERTEKADPPEVPKPVERADATFWVWHNPHPRYTRVHKGTCANCRNGYGKGAVKPGGKWYGFASLDGARAKAIELEPHKFSECKMCIGTYRTRSRPN